MSRRHREDSHDAHPATLRPAVAFIDDNAHLEITIADIARYRAAYGVMPSRTLRRLRS